MPWAKPMRNYQQEREKRCEKQWEKHWEKHWEKRWEKWLASVRPAKNNGRERRGIAIKFGAEDVLFSE